MVARTILTYDGMEAAPSDGLRRELLGGDLYVSPAPSLNHQRVVGKLFVVLDAYAERHGGEAFASPVDVVFSQVDAVQPDLVYFAPDRLSVLTKKNVQGPPSLLVEVLSPATSDVDPGRKLETYATYGVPEYWIIDPETRSAVAHAEPSGNRYLRAANSTDGTITAMTLPELSFTIPKPRI
ncbi:MAG: Uma2 family endonuclease [Candidatus Eremiobacteraeota bacterium]|nr:Uma2 family endonuclease [Candidatus Eremiobacteraeota bacterium]